MSQNKHAALVITRSLSPKSKLAATKERISVIHMNILRSPRSNIPKSKLAATKEKNWFKCIDEISLIHMNINI